MTEIVKKIKLSLLLITTYPFYKKYSLIVIPVVCSLFGLLIIVLITVPQVFKIVDKNKELGLIKQKQTEYQAKTAALDKIDLDFYKNGLNNLTQALPSDKDIPSAINSILELLSISGLQLTNFSLGPTLAGPGGSESFSVNLEVNGSLEQIKNLINAQNSSDRLLKIVGLSLTNSASTNLQGSIDILVYYAPLDVNPKIAADQKITPLSDEETQLLNQIEQNLNLSGANPGVEIQDAPTGKDDPFN